MYYQESADTYLLTTFYYFISYPYYTLAGTSINLLSYKSCLICVAVCIEEAHTMSQLWGKMFKVTNTGKVATLLSFSYVETKINVTHLGRNK